MLNYYVKALKEALNVLRVRPLQTVHNNHKTLRFSNLMTKVKPKSNSKTVMLATIARRGYRLALARKIVYNQHLVAFTKTRDEN